MMYILYFLMIVSILSILYKFSNMEKFYKESFYYPFIFKTMNELSTAIDSKVKIEKYKMSYNLNDFCFMVVELVTVVWVGILKYDTLLYWIFVCAGIFSPSLIMWVLKKKYEVWDTKVTKWVCKSIYFANELFGTVYYVYLLKEFGLLKNLF